MNTWPAFWLSLAVPGAGQLLARSWTAPAWFLLAGLVGVFSAQWLANCDAPMARAWVISSHATALLIIGVASGFHARRLLTPKRRPARSSANPATRSRVQCYHSRGRSMRLTIEVATTHSPAELWRIISDLPNFLTIDPFHERVHLMRPRPAAGVDLVLDHLVFGVRVRRVGRILAWREGREFTISDLSLRGKHVGFPHVFHYRIEPALKTDQAAAIDCKPAAASVLRIEVRGKWTSPVIPARLGRLWLAGVCYDHARLLRQAL